MILAVASIGSSPITCDTNQNPPTTVEKRPTQAPIDVALGVLTEAGFDEAAAMTAFRILNSYVYGYATAELSGLAIVAAAEAGMSAGEVPHVTRVLPFVAAIDRDAEFEHGLDVILAGL
jgi:hypothetical protein